MGQLNIDGYVTAGVGALLFIVGLAFMLFLVKKKVIQANFASDTLGCIINQLFSFFIGKAL